MYARLVSSGNDDAVTVLCRTRQRMLRGQFENSFQTAVAAHKIIQRYHVELVIKRFHSTADKSAQPALSGQRAGILLSRKTLGEGNARFENAENSSDTDIAWPEAELKPACPAAYGLDKAVLLELMNDMTQVIARCIAGLGDVGRPDHLAVIDGAKHQYTGCKVCSGGQAHGAVPVALIDSINMLF